MSIRMHQEIFTHMFGRSIESTPLGYLCRCWFFFLDTGERSYVPQSIVSSSFLCSCLWAVIPSCCATLTESCCGKSEEGLFTYDDSQWEVD